MNSQSISNASPGTLLFPEFETIFVLVKREVETLTDEQLDFTSKHWQWAHWSIRNQLSHMSSLIYRWLILRWGPTVFPNGDHGVDDVGNIAESKFDRRLDDDIYWDLNLILRKLCQGIKLVHKVLSEHNVEFLKSHSISRQATPQWLLMSQAHQTGISVLGDPAEGEMTLESTIRHIYFEEITHLYNIHRLKRAQGLPTVVSIPKVGYWVLDGWDRSEP